MRSTSSIGLAILIAAGALPSATAGIIEDIEKAAKDVVEAVQDVGTSAWDRIGEVGQGAACYAALKTNPFAIYAYIELLGARAAGDIKNRHECENTITEAAKIAKAALDRGVSGDMAGWLWSKCLCLAAFPDGGGKSPPPPPTPPEPALEFQNAPQCTVDRLLPIGTAPAEAFRGNWGDASQADSSKILVRVGTDVSRNVLGRTTFTIYATDRHPQQCPVNANTSSSYATMAVTPDYRGSQLGASCAPTLRDALKGGRDAPVGRREASLGIPRHADEPATSVRKRPQGPVVPRIDPRLPPKSLVLTNIPNEIELWLYGAYCGDSFQGYRVRYIRRTSEGVNDVMLQRAQRMF